MIVWTVSAKYNLVLFLISICSDGMSVEEAARTALEHPQLFVFGEVLEFPQMEALKVGTRASLQSK